MTNILLSKKINAFIFMAILSITVISQENNADIEEVVTVSSKIEVPAKDVVGSVILVTLSDLETRVVNDLQEVIINGKNEFPNSKHILFAHSMGSWIAISAMLKGLEVDGVILSGSNKLNTFLAKFIKTLTSFLIFFYGNQSESNLLERLTIGTYNKKYQT